VAVLLWLWSLRETLLYGFYMLTPHPAAAEVNRALRGAPSTAPRSPARSETIPPQGGSNVRCASSRRSAWSSACRSPPTAR
jgi:hypothetical protein